ncbi:MAG: hypothetical protein HXX09_09495 [Bacteroidetes bacterium]|nr:hypothetical protein [Bacteroidota bacterium]
MVSKLLFILQFISFLSPKEIKPNLIGIWQNEPSIGSGWSDNIQFFADGTYKYNYSQMKCDKRIISMQGSWSYEENGDLKLVVIREIVIEGGKLVPATGSCASKFEIEGGEIKTKIKKIPEINILKLSDFFIDSENNNLETIKFDDNQFWKIEKDPNNYF